MKLLDNKGDLMMNKQRIRVINKGRRVRERLGSRFLPNQEQELFVNSRQYLTLKAVKDFEVELLDNNHSNIDSDSDNDTDNHDDGVDSEDNAKDIVFDEELDYYDLNIEEVLKAVTEGIFDVDEAIALEVAGKNRVTLLEKLEELKQED